jgi:4-hydroxy-3-methylbut-2-enyl diphosphate reductase
LVELCAEKLPTYFIDSSEKILSAKEILHYDIHTNKEELANNFLPQKFPVKVLITSGASCPDALVEGVINKLNSFFPANKSLEEMMQAFA